MKTQVSMSYDFTEQLNIFSEHSNRSILDSIENQKQQIKKICVQTFCFIILCQQVEYSGPNLIARSVCLHRNGMPFLIPKPYHSKFQALMNGITQNCRFSFKKESYELELFTVFCNVVPYEEQKYEQEFKNAVKFVLRKMEEVLQIIGYTKQFNNIQKKLKGRQLQLRKKTISIISQSKKSQEILPKEGKLFPSISQVRAIKKVYQIEEIQEENTQIVNKNGGFFTVSKRKCQISSTQNQSTVKFLASKKPKTSSKLSQAELEQKMLKQIEFVKKVTNQQHLGKYYECQKQSQKLYMEYIPNSLKDLIVHQNLSMSELVNIGLQLIDGVMNLHDSNIVHRDLKPENILIDTQGSKKHLKIIDFGESVIIENQNQKQQRLGCTMPYSPPQCLLRNIEGLNRKEIDFWSVVIILYEMTFHSLPLSFSRIVGGDIIESWKDPEKFSIFPSYNKGRGLQGIKQIISLLTISGLKISQSQRLDLSTISLVLKEIQKFQADCCLIFSPCF